MYIFFSLMLFLNGMILGINEREKMIHNDLVDKKQGCLKSKDKDGTPLLVEWFCDTMFSPENIDKMASLWDVARVAYVPIEVDFLKSFPNVVGAEPYYKPFEPLFINGIEHVDWAHVAIIMEQVLKNHFVIDVSKIPISVRDLYQNNKSIIVMVKNEQTGEICAFMTFMMSAEYPAGYVKAIAAGVLPSMQGHGIGKLMMRTLFSIVRDLTVIFLTTRVTNKNALQAYASWGFVQCDNPIQDSQHIFNPNHWIFMKYDATQCRMLQD